ncbi:MAG: 30S ribosomal protein S6 [Nitrospinae bacterium]|nr:30S ribosomal protein S6 [Nitrospinota bacterium]
MQRDYETVFIVKPDLADEQIDKEINTVKDLITAEGGSIMEEDRWGKKRLGYAIRKNRYGFYTLLRYSLETGKMPVIDRHFRLNENILKSLTVYFDGAAGRMAPGAAPARAESDAGDESEAGGNGES